MFDGTMNFALGDEIDALRDTVRKWAQAKLAPRAAEIDHTNTFAADLWPQLGAMGLLGITADPDYGGTGMTYVAHVVAMEEISRASASAFCTAIAARRSFSRAPPSCASLCMR